MALHSFAPLSRLSYGAGSAGILPACRQRLGRVARFCRLPAPHALRKTGVKLSSGGTLATIFGQKHDIALITPMTKLVILEYPDPRLRKKAEPVAVVDDAVRRLADDMLETMYAANGVGLAATQVDVHKRLLVLDLSEARNQPLVLINPEILTAEGCGPGEEGCLSLPGIYEKLQRATHIRVRALGRRRRAVRNGRGWLAGGMHPARDGPPRRQALRRLLIRTQAPIHSAALGKGASTALRGERYGTRSAGAHAVLRQAPEAL